MMCVKRFNELAQSVRELQTDVQSLQAQQWPRAPTSKVPVTRRSVLPNTTGLTLDQRLAFLKFPTAPSVPRATSNRRTTSNANLNARFTALVGGPRQRKALAQTVVLQMQGEASRMKKRRRTARNNSGGRNSNNNSNNSNNNNNNGNFRTRLARATLPAVP